MSIPLQLARALLVTTALVAPSLAFAQATPASPPAEAPTTGTVVATPAATQPQEESVDVSVPGGGDDIVVTGRRDRNIAKSSDQVVSVLGAAEIARTGEGNIAGALGRVTGLSVVGSGYVYVRGLGDRYSLALLNGSPLPSPEPLRRVVPLDIFPSGVIASSLVQKSYSVNYPGEFGGGVINLTTRSVPREPFLTFGTGISGDTETTGHLGYTYFGSRSDNSGFDNGERNIPPALAAFFKSGDRISSGNVNTQAIASQLVTGRNAVVQRWSDIPVNFSANLTGGTSFEVGGGELGVIAAAGYSNKYTTREAIQQSSLSADVSTLESDFTQVNTDQRIVVNGLLGFGYEFDDNKIRFTNLYIRDTIKQARLALGNKEGTSVDFMQQKTAWYERQLINSQLVSELTLSEGLKLDIRAGYANSQREAPDELSVEYVRTNSAADPYGAYFVNRLNNGNGGDAGITFSDLGENLYSAGIDLSYRFSPGISATVGGIWSDTQRTSTRREFQFLAPGDFPTGIGMFRPDLLLQPSIINFYKIGLVETDEGNPAFFARLLNYAGYAKVNTAFTDTLSLDIGVRYERATQTVDPIQVFNVPGASTAGTRLERTYWLPAATLTWQVGNAMQVRLSGSKTIARPQFRELINQPYFDPDSNRPYRGNPLLVDSQLYNAEARFEWYFAPDQKLSVSGFYKKLDRPIEAFITGGDLVTSFANAPSATLYGAELEVQKNINLDTFINGGFFAARRVILIGNYTYTKSKVKVSAGDTTTVFGASSTIASDYFRDGAPLTGQSDHIANIQIGLEHPDRLSQQTLLLSYASDRVVSRGLNGSTPQPDVIERPGFRIDFVAREAVKLFDKEIELKFEARNITGQKHEEFQTSGTNRIDINTYKVGTTFALSATVKLR
ncbi:MAG: TonB-dependent receptor [Sphingomonadales bacterium]